MYLDHMLNNVGAINYHNHFSDCDLELKTNINKLKIADTLIKNQRVKNIVLNNIAFKYLMEDQNVVNNKEFLKTYHQFSTDKSKKNEVLKLEMPFSYWPKEKNYPKCSWLILMENRIF